MPSLKGRVEKILELQSTRAGISKSMSEILSLLNERTDEVVKVLRESIVNALPMYACLHFPNKVLVERKEVLQDFDTASLSLKSDQERE